MRPICAHDGCRAEVSRHMAGVEPDQPAFDCRYCVRHRDGCRCWSVPRVLSITEPPEYVNGRRNRAPRGV